MGKYLLSYKINLYFSTIISDILSRILNETVMREEIVCRICYNLLNDVDYHLKVQSHILKSVNMNNEICAN